MKQKAFLAVVVASIIMSLSGLLIKSMTIPATSMAFIRMLVPTLVVGVYLVAKGVPLFRNKLPFIFGISALNSARMFMFFSAYVYTSIGNAVIILYTWPIFATIFGVFILKETISTRNILLLILAFVGIIIVNHDKTFSWESSDFIGMMAAFGCAIVYALMMILFKRESDNFRLPELIFYQNFIPTLVFLPFFLNNQAPTALDWGLATTQGLLIGLIGYLLFFFGLRHLKASTYSMITYLEIIGAIAIGVLILGETLSVGTVIGGVCIVISTLLLKTK